MNVAKSQFSLVCAAPRATFLPVKQSARFRSALSPFALAAVSLLSSVANGPAATVHYVDLNSTNASPPYTNWDTAARDIQSAVDVAETGDTVLVTNGIYVTGGRAVDG